MAPTEACISLLELLVFWSRGLCPLTYDKDKPSAFGGWWNQDGGLGYIMLQLTLQRMILLCWQSNSF